MNTITTKDTINDHPPLFSMEKTSDGSTFKTITKKGILKCPKCGETEFRHVINTASISRDVVDFVQTSDAEWSNEVGFIRLDDPPEILSEDEPILICIHCWEELSADEAAELVEWTAVGCEEPTEN